MVELLQNAFALSQLDANVAGIHRWVPFATEMALTAGATQAPFTRTAGVVHGCTHKPLSRTVGATHTRAATVNTALVEVGLKLPIDGCATVMVVVPARITVTLLSDTVATFGSLLLKTKVAGLADCGATSANGASPSVFASAETRPA